ncbi:MAG: hypothetical protein ACI4Q0_06680 [Oligosphaeraceae bacterium]
MKKSFTLIELLGASTSQEGGEDSGKKRPWLPENGPTPWRGALD